MRQAFAIALLLGAASTVQVPAQQRAAPEPFLRAALDPPRVVVGQPTTLTVDVLAPNYMTAPPVLPEFQLRNAVTRPLGTINQTEQRDGMTYAGVRFEFALHPLEPGTYAVAGMTVTLTYAAAPPATREVTLALPRLDFQAFIPDAAAALDPFVSATRLTVEQDVQRSSEHLKVGDALTRIITIKAEGAPAMLLPPLRLAEIDGLARYPADPSLQEHTDRRTDALSATRVDQATYMLQRAGEFLLPAIEIRWWNVAAERIESARLDAVALQVMDNPAAGTASPPQEARSHWRRLADAAVEHWPSLIGGTALLLVLAWLLPRLTRALVRRYRQRREIYLRSEAYAFARLRAAARGRDPSRAYFALLDWLDHFAPLGADRTVAALRRAGEDPALDAELAAIERRLFAPKADPAGWSGRTMLRHLRGARHRLRRRAGYHQPAPTLPPDLNPVTPPRQAARRQRAVAR